MPPTHRRRATREPHVWFSRLKREVEKLCRNGDRTQFSLALKRRDLLQNLAKAREAGNADFIDWVERLIKNHDRMHAGYRLILKKRKAILRGFDRFEPPNYGLNYLRWAEKELEKLKANFKGVTEKFREENGALTVSNKENQGFKEDK